MSFRHLLSLTLITALPALLGGCASIVSKSQYPVSISSDPSGADIVVQDETGRTYLSAKTPTTVTLEAGAGYFKGRNYKVTYSLPGYARYTAEISRGVDGWYIAGNIVFGGLIGWFVVDPITGAMWTLPKEVHATLLPNTAANADPDALYVVTLDQIPAAMRDHLVQVR
jgi:uncharacterized protein YceK